MNCTANVGEPPHYFHYHQCTRKATYIINGHPRCTQHKKGWENSARVTGAALKIEAVA